ncbi:2-oxoglutarate receptor 1 isoform X2 [Salvelinus sp. IW2-2015]|uniref:2-oxoglutarate receptor 1 isoform X2 n=1 Tax=Salvelinus sp. IW2-2015 TaxID=2691554 RepID=UPI000CDF9C12|nr:2-oxoglutarate receptor 1 isoform X2 [Salvelinus alpinus]
MSSAIYGGNKSDHNCTNVDKLMKLYYLPVMYSVIFTVGLLGNVTSIAIYLAKLRPWKSSSIIMVNLALTDLLYVLSLPFLVYYYTHVLAHPLRTAQVQQKRWGILACAAVWAIAGAEIVPMLTMITMENNNNKTTCWDFASNDLVVVWWYGWLLTVLGYLLPLVVVVVCYAGIARELAKGPHTHSPCRVRARRLTVLILVVFVVCFLPYHVLRILRIDTRRKPESSCMLENWVHAAYIISRPIAGLNTFFNLGLYTLAGDKFQQAFLSVFPWGPWWTKFRTHLKLSLAVVSKPSNTASAERTVATDMDIHRHP